MISMCRVIHFELQSRAVPVPLKYELFRRIVVEASI